MELFPHAILHGCDLGRRELVFTKVENILTASDVTHEALTIVLEMERNASRHTAQEDHQPQQLQDVHVVFTERFTCLARYSTVVDGQGNEQQKAHHSQNTRPLAHTHTPRIHTTHTAPPLPSQQLLPSLAPHYHHQQLNHHRHSQPEPC